MICARWTRRLRVQSVFVVFGSDEKKYQVRTVRIADFSMD